MAWTGNEGDKAIISGSDKQCEHCHEANPSPNNPSRSSSTSEADTDSRLSKLRVQISGGRHGSKHCSSEEKSRNSSNEHSTAIAK